MMNVSSLKYLVGMLSLVAAGLFTSGCFIEVGIPAEGDNKWGELNPIQGMIVQEHFRDQSSQPIYRDDQPYGMRIPAEGSVTTQSRSQSHTADPTVSAHLTNPVAMTEENIRYGGMLFDTNCAVCHGKDGKGEGYVVPKFPNPPSLTSDRARGMEDGRIYHVITHGQGVMGSYKTHLQDVERWAVVNYIRALQRADFPEPKDLERVRN